MSGRIGDLSPKQETALKELRERMLDSLQPEHDDRYLLRWLRARSFDVKKAEQMLRDNLMWRKNNAVDTILDDYVIPEVLQKYFPGGLFGQDKEGSLIWIDIPGRADQKGLARSVKKQEFLRSKMHLLETMYRRFDILTKEQGRRVEQIIILFDMEFFGLKNLWKPAIDVFIDMVKMFEDRYPETLKSCFVINAPRIFPIAYNLIRPFLSEDTAKKIQILGASYKQTLLKYIDADQLPEYWGGSLQDPDGNPYCSSQICLGGTVPEEYYGEDLLDLTGFTEVSIKRGSSLQVEVNVKQPRSVIRWQFKTSGFDIGFGIFRRTAENRQKANEMVAVCPSERVNSHLIPEDGSVTVQEDGTYIVRFDNTYSWTHSKTLHYLIEVLEPTSESYSMPQLPSSNSLYNGASDET